jgi:hypothetical protein
MAMSGRTGVNVMKEMKEQIENLLKMGIIEECKDSPFAFPIVMAKRPGSNRLRLCIDFKYQNVQTEPYARRAKVTEPGLVSIGERVERVDWSQRGQRGQQGQLDVRDLLKQE